MPLLRGLQPKSGQQRAELDELGFHLSLYLEGMIRDLARGLVLELFLQVHDLASEIEVLG